jgi:hypothetical protein
VRLADDLLERLPVRARAVPLAFLLLPIVACGSRTGLFSGVLPSTTEDAGGLTQEAGPDAPILAPCAAFPAIPATPSSNVGAACAFSASAPTSPPVLAAINGDEVLFLRNVAGTGASLESVYTFGLAPAGIEYLAILSRGEYVGAIISGSPSEGTADVELVLLRLDGTVLAHHRESRTLPNGGSGAVAIAGNAGGTFAFSLIDGDASIWEAIPDGSLIGPFEGLSFYPSVPWAPPVDPDARGRLLVERSTGAPAPSWLDPCTGKLAPAELTVTAGWGTRSLGVTTGGQLETETADGTMPLSYPSLGSMAQVFAWSAPATLLFAVPPLAVTNDDANLVVVNAATLAGHALSLSYPGLVPIPADTNLDMGDTSANPDGFGVDSSGNVTMFLQDGTGQSYLEVTGDGSHWTPVGDALAPGLPTEPQAFQLRYAERGGTYVIMSQSGNGSAYQIARPADAVVTSFMTSDGTAVPVDTNTTGYDVVSVAADGGCVSALVSATDLDITQATTGTRTVVSFPSGMPTVTWTSTWIPGDDASLYVP